MAHSINKYILKNKERKNKLTKTENGKEVTAIQFRSWKAERSLLNVLMDPRKLNNKPLVKAEKHSDKYHSIPPPKDKDLEVSGYFWK